MKLSSVSSLSGTITVPGDKSISHRAVMLGALSNGKTTVSGFLNGADCLSTVSCFEKLGVKTVINGSDVCIKGLGLRGLKAPTEVLYTGNSGTTTRIISGILSAQSFKSTIDGDASIRKRPMGHVKKPLEQMGASFDGEYCPVTITPAQLKAIDYTLPVASAQLKSAIMLAALYADNISTIHESVPCRNHTELMLSAMGAPIKQVGGDILVSPCENLNAMHIDVPGDISSAAFFMVAACITKNSDITIKNVGVNTTRTGIIDALVNMGANISIQNIHFYGREPVADIRVRSSNLHGTTIGGEIIPRLIDELPVLAVAAAFAKGTTSIKDAGQLKVKESNRIDTMVCELKKASVDITATPDGMIIEGNKKAKGNKFCAYSDHRIAMSMAVLALAADGESEIDDPDAVNISFPEFFEILKKLSK